MPGSRIVTQHLTETWLLAPSRLPTWAGYGCTTCIGNAVTMPVLTTPSRATPGRCRCRATVISEARIHLNIKANFRQPSLVVSTLRWHQAARPDDWEPVARRRARCTGRHLAEQRRNPRADAPRHARQGLLRANYAQVRKGRQASSGAPSAASRASPTPGRAAPTLPSRRSSTVLLSIQELPARTRKALEAKKALNPSWVRVIMALFYT